MVDYHTYFYLHITKNDPTLLAHKCERRDRLELSNLHSQSR